MRKSQLLVAGLATAVGLFGLSTQSSAQTGGAATAAPGLTCNGTRMLDPFQGSLAGPDLPPGLLPISDAVKSGVLSSGLPCQENVSTGAQADPAGKEAAGLENLQRGFDFYSWRTFIALNSPADGSPIEQRASRRADAVGGYEQFQAAARRHAAGRFAAAEMAGRSGRDGSRARKVGAAGVPRAASSRCPRE